MTPLENVRVLEVSEAMAAPYCAMLLGDFGADVIKVERRGAGDQSRGWGPPFISGESAYFLCCNRNKRSITLDTKHVTGLEILGRLIERADVLILNQPSRASLARRGLDPETLCARHPRLIYCSVTGYGHTGPKTDRPGYDILAQAEAGVMSFTGEPDGEPMRYPIAIADVTCAIYAALGILAALLAREKTGRGQFLDMALLDSQLTWLANAASSYLNAGVEPRRLGNAHPSIVPYQPFRAGDGRYFIVAVGTEALWKKFCEVLGLSKTTERDPRFATNRDRIEHREELVAQLDEIFRKQTATTWLERFLAAEIPAAPLQTVAEALADLQALARGAIVEIEHPAIGAAKSIANPVKLSGTPVVYRLPPPRLGEHTEIILREIGLEETEIRAAREGGAA